MRQILLAGVLLASAQGVSQGPWVGGQREYIFGLKPQGASVLGLYVYRATGVSTGPLYNRDGVELRLGWMGWKVMPGVFGGKDCLVLETDGFTTITRNGKTIQLRQTAKIVRQTYVSPEGRLLREVFSIEDGASARSGEAIFASDEIELKVSDERGRRVTNVFPAGGTAQLDDAFKPMVKDGQVVLREKTFGV